MENIPSASFGCITLWSSFRATTDAVDPEQTTKGESDLRSSLIWVYSVCTVLSDQKHFSTFITLCLGSIEMDHVISETCYKESFRK